MSFFKLLIALLVYNQRLLVYPWAFFDEGGVDTPYSYGLQECETIILTTTDKVRLECFLIRGDWSRIEDPKGIVVIFHGNAMNAGDILRSAREFVKQGYYVFVLEYRGFGNSDGKPSEKGLCIDAQCAMDHILGDASLSKLPIILYGMSLGGAVAVDCASKNSHRVTALVLENTFTSIPDIVRGLPYIRFLSFMCTQKWRSKGKVALLPKTLPILMLSGLQDQVIPPKHMQELWETSRCRNPRQYKKCMWKKYTPPVDLNEDCELPTKDVFKTFPRGEHGSTWAQEGYWDAIFEFLKDITS